MLTLDQLAAIGNRAPNDNMRSIIAGLDVRGAEVGLDLPHRQAQYLAQLAHETMGFHYDRELWGPTAAQRRYDTRTDLGNTAARDGDGKLYRGRGPIQITGRSNYRQFTAWAHSFDPAAPDFVANPDAVNTDPWEGLGPIWYWQSRDLNRYADEGDIEMVTRRINGGLNGYADRLHRYDRAALVLLDYEPEAVRRFQDDAGLVVDGISGPKTRAAMHSALCDIPAPEAQSEPVAPAEPVSGSATHAAARQAVQLLSAALAADQA